MSRASLAAVLALPKSTVVGVVDELIERGLVVEGPARGDGRAGRPARALRLVGPQRVVGVAVWSLGTQRVAIADPQGQILASSEFETDQQTGAAAIADPAVEQVAALLAQVRLEPSSLNAIVLGVPAPFRPTPGGSPQPAGLDNPLPAGWVAWLDHDPGPEVQARLRAPTVVENDANLGALGEGAYGAARGLDSFIYVKIGDRSVGAGLVIGGRLHRGVAGFAGELAHVQVHEDGPLCQCGGRGCLLGLLDATLLQASRPSYEHPPPLRDLLELAERGEAAPRRILADLGRTLGRPLADLCTLLNPAAIIVDGSLGPAGSHVIEGVRQAIDRHSSPIAADTTAVLAGTLGDRADLLGGVVLAREESLADVAL